MVEKGSTVNTIMAAVMVVTAGGTSLVNRDASQDVIGEVRGMREDISQVVTDVAVLKVQVKQLEGSSNGSE